MIFAMPCTPLSCSVSPLFPLSGVTPQNQQAGLREHCELPHPVGLDKAQPSNEVKSPLKTNISLNNNCD